MFKFKYLLLVAFLAAFTSFTALATGEGLDNDYEEMWDDDMNQEGDENCLTDGATCCWTFGLYCPVEVECEGDNDLGDYCIDEDGITSEDIETYDAEEGWIYFRIAGEDGSSFYFNANAEAEAEDEDGNTVAVEGYQWQISNEGDVEAEYTNIPSSEFESSEMYQSTPSTGAVNNLFTIGSADCELGECVDVENTDTWVRVRPTSIDLDGAVAGETYEFCVSVGIEAANGL